MQMTDLPIISPTPLAVVYHRHGWTTFLRHPIACLLPGRVMRYALPESTEVNSRGVSGT